MRLALILYGSLDTVSGGYLYDRQLVAHLRRAGDSVEIISLPWRNYARHLADNFSASLVRRLCDGSFDVVLQDELNHPSLAFLNRRLRTVMRIPIMAIVHHLRCYEQHRAPLRVLYRWVEARYLASVDGFICNSMTTRDAISATLGWAPLRVVVAYPAGDRFAMPITRDAIYRRTQHPGALRILFVGNVIRRKGLHTLLDALAQLPRADFELTIVGNPYVDMGYTRAMRRQIATRHLRAHWVGALGDDALAQTLSAGDVLVVPSQYEGFGIAYLEAMGFGLPAIATTAGAAREIIADEVNGFLVAPNDARALAVRLAELQHNRVQLARLSLAARDRFLIQPTWETSMAKVRQALVEWTR